MSKTLRVTFATLVFFIAAFVLAAFVSSAGGCTADQLAAFSKDHSKAAPTTQAIEKMSEKIDSLAGRVEQIGPRISAAADAGKGLGLPFTDWLKYGAMAVTGAATWWIGRRKP